VQSRRTRAEEIACSVEEPISLAQRGFFVDEKGLGGQSPSHGCCAEAMRACAKRGRQRIAWPNAVENLLLQQIQDFSTEKNCQVSFQFTNRHG
jgi:hypothetical protein